MVKRYKGTITIQGLALYVVDRALESGFYGNTRDEAMEAILLRGIRRMDTTHKGSKLISAADLSKLKGTLDALIEGMIDEADPKLNLSLAEAVKLGYLGKSKAQRRGRK